MINRYILFYLGKRAKAMLLSCEAKTNIITNMHVKKSVNNESLTGTK